QYQQRRDMVALLDLLVMNRDNPRSLAWVVQTLRARLAKAQDAELALGLPDPDTWALTELSYWRTDPEGHRQYITLAELLNQCEVSAANLSDDLTRLHFSHADQRNQSV
ncbi:MAG TPA: alpha-E domain-containing protein, partial [Hydrogenophaga sp.]